MFNFNIWNIVCTIINILIFYLLLKKFFFKKIMDTMDKRKNMIDSEIKEARDKNAQAQEIKEQYENELQSADEEKQRIISQAKDSAKTEYNKIVELAQTDAQAIKNEAKIRAQEERDEVLRSAKESIASLAVEAAQKIVGENITASTDSDIFDEFLNESSETNG